eukprot:5919802-Amphidinium_carterae.3
MGKHLTQISPSEKARHQAIRMSRQSSGIPGCCCQPHEVVSDCKGVVKRSRLFKPDVERG